MARAALALYALFAIACASRIDDPAILPYGGRDGSIANSDGGTSCQYKLTPVTIDTLAVVDQLTALTDGAAIRVQVFYRRPGCAVPGPVDAVVEPTPGVDTVGLTAYLWTHDPAPNEACDMVSDWRLVSISDAVPSLSQANLVIRDLEGSTAIKLTVGTRPQKSCDPVAAGDLCQLDCQCAASDPRARCLVGWGRCGVSCFEQVDCAAGQMCDVLGKKTPVFGMCTAGNQCGNGSGCLARESCLSDGKGAYCAADLPGPRIPCACNDDCGAERICTGDGMCEVPCASNNECPPSLPHCTSGICTK